MKKLTKDKERFIENYIHNHHSMWSLYFLGGKQRIPFLLAENIKLYKQLAEEEEANPQTYLPKRYQFMNRDRYKFYLYLSEKFDGNNAEALAYWVERGKYHKMLIDSNKGTPPMDKRDNKAMKVGSGGGNKNKIRYPKKCRKTAWKRFYKLFPMLDPNNKI